MVRFEAITTASPSVPLPVFLVALALVTMPSPAAASRESAALRAQAYQLAYNLDYDEAARRMDAAAKADPSDVASERGRAVIPWLQISFRLGTTTVDDYLGQVNKQNVAMREPPADLAAAFKRHVAEAIRLGEAAVAARPNDAEALYQLGAAHGLRASYIATVEGRVMGAYSAARRAYNLSERVLEIDPSRKDAGLVAGMYRYFISTLSAPMRVFAYMAGFGGGKERGIRLIEEAATMASDAQTEARLALVLIYNRERRYDDAIRVLAALERDYSRNRLLVLESAGTALRAGRAAETERIVNEALTRLETDARPKMFGEEALWLQRRGSARVMLNRPEDAGADLQRALRLPARTWVSGRLHAELGKIADLRGDRQAARKEFLLAMKLAEQDRDWPGAADARRLADVPYRARR